MKKLLLPSLALLSITWCPATVLLNAGFESAEGYTLGPLATGSSSQLGWAFVGVGGDTTGKVVASNPWQGARSVEVDANTVSSSGWWYKNTLFDTSSSQEKVVRVTWAQLVMPPSGTPDFTNSSAYGVLSYADDVTFITGLYFDNYDAKLYIFSDSLQDWVAVATPGVRGQYMRLGYTVNYSDRVVQYEVGGTVLPETSLSQTTGSVFGDADIHIRYATTDKAYFDDLRVETFKVGSLVGNVVLADFTGDLATRPLAIEIRNPGSTTPLETLAATLDANGRFVVQTGRRGVFDVGIKSTTHLRKVLPNVKITGNGAYGLDATLANGDVDGDNMVTVFDYNGLSDAFDSATGDPNWNSAADLDGDGLVTVFDYNILSNNFDLAGDN